MFNFLLSQFDLKYRLIKSRPQPTRPRKSIVIPNGEQEVFDPLGLDLFWQIVE